MPPCPAAASNVTLLVFSAVALHLPFRLHLAVQALNVALQTRFGLSPFCASRLMASAVMQERVAAAHGGLAVLAAPVTPFGVLLVPQGEHVWAVRCSACAHVGWARAHLTPGCTAMPGNTLPSRPRPRPHPAAADARHRCAAFLLLCWLLLGWLVPSLLLLPRQAGAGARAPAQGKAAAVAGAVGGTLEAWLRMLRFGSTQRRGGGGGGLPAVPRVVHAFFVVVAAWTCSCLAAEALL